ncbi:MAG: hypothetical protein ACJAUP_001974 [Cellvibrionaceae bacterium]
MTLKGIPSAQFEVSLLFQELALVMAYKEMMVRLLLVTVGFFGTPALFRATGAADHFAQLESAGYCNLDLRFMPTSYDACLSERLGGKPYW